MSTRILRVEIATLECNTDEAYTFDLPEDTDKFRVIDAAETLYGPEGVVSISMFLVEIDDGGPLKRD